MTETHTDWLSIEATPPTFRLRVNVGRTATAVVYDATIEMTWSGTPGTYTVDGEDRSVDDALAELRDRAQADIAARVHEARRMDTYVPKPGKVA
jgi:hypothetical protein